MNLLPSRILWATDFSELSLDSGDYVRRLADRLAAALYIVHVFEPPSTPEESYFSTDENGWGNPDTAALYACRDRLSVLAAEEFAGVRVAETAVIFGEPWQSICGYAAEISADLIVLSTHGRRGLRHALLASTADRVVQHAPCSVLVVKRSIVSGLTREFTSRAAARKDAIESESRHELVTESPATGAMGNSS